MCVEVAWLQARESKPPQRACRRNHSEAPTKRNGDESAVVPTARFRNERRRPPLEHEKARIDRGYFARPWAQGDPEQVVRSFLCECGQPDCSESVEVTVKRATQPVYSAGHG